MALIDLNGFETNTTTANTLGFDTVTNVTNGTTNVRSGSRAAQITSLASGTARGLNKKYQTAASTTDFLSVYIYIVAYPSADNQIMNFSNTTSLATGQRCSISLSSTGTLKLFNAVPTQIGSASSVLSLNTWYLVELKCDTVPASGSRTIEGRVGPDDGTTPTVFATSSAQSQGTASSISMGGNLLLEAQTTGQWWFDDYQFNNSSGSFQTSYPGPHKLVRLYPSAAGDNTTWTSTGTNWSALIDNPPDDATSGNRAATSGNIDDFNIDDTPGAIGSGDTINAIAVGVRYAADTATQANNAIWKTRFKSSSGGTVSESAGIQANSTGYNTNDNASPRLPLLKLYQTPDATTLTKANLDTAQIGYNLSTSSGTSTVTRVTTLWLDISYTPVSTPATGITFITSRPPWRS